MTREEFYDRYQYDNRKNKIGGGAFGTVYRAYDRRLDREVAVKVQEIKDIEGKEFSLQSEYDAIKALDDHPNIANYESVHRYSDGPGVFDYGIMQFYPLGNLSSYLKNTEADEVEKSKILVQILQGIAYLHHKKVVHRDIKPGNILVVNRPGEGIIPKITDFGLSKLAEIDDSHSLFKNSFAGGTVEYSSPEQLRGSHIKFNTDLWSFGIIIFEVFTGKTLFDPVGHAEGTAGKQGEIIQQIFKKDFSDEFNKLPETWQPIAKLCLQRNPNDRPSTGKDLLRSLPIDLYNLEKDIFLKENANNTEASKTKILDDQETVTAILSIDDGAEDKTIIIDHAELEGISAEDNDPVTTEPVNKRGGGNRKIWAIGIAAAVLAGIVIAIMQFGTTNKGASYLAMVTENGKTGYIDFNGDAVIAPSYQAGLYFSEGLAPIKTSSGWNYIDIEEKPIISGNFALATPFSDGLALVKNGDDWFYIDKKGNKAFDQNFKAAKLFANNKAPVLTDSGWAFIDKDGNPVFNQEFEAANSFSNGLAAVKKMGKWGFIDGSGKQVIGFNYLQAGDYAEDMVAVLNTDEKWVFINTDEEVLIDRQFDRAKKFSEGMAAVRLGDKWGFIDKKGKQVIDFTYERTGSFKTGFAPVRTNSKWGFIDKSGKETIATKFSAVDEYKKIN
ncbi:serine/threonine-protein kinase [Flagellimonas myxillae]|uniref:serine/threonine-protein kinase n=1 Tax=Flagellimonas myxillae TaxID=2942214 RepID=UPI00201EDA80|nr:serine/threonine-protein kinase [Muricauda myxillae]MCL6265062.1 WG repeat-containing protein [Muricauda myxillae]